MNLQEVLRTNPNTDLLLAFVSRARRTWTEDRLYLLDEMLSGQSSYQASVRARKAGVLDRSQHVAWRLAKQVELEILHHLGHTASRYVGLIADGVEVVDAPDALLPDIRKGLEEMGIEFKEALHIWRTNNNGT